MRKPGWVRDAHRRYASLFAPPIAPNAIPNLYAQHTGGVGLTVANPTIPSANDFASVNWTKTNATIIANNTTDPIGTNTADRMTDTVTNGDHQVNQNASGANVLGYATIQVYAKAGTANYCILSGNAGAIKVAFNLTTGVAGASTGTYLWTKSTDASNGWWLLELCYLTSVSAVTIGMNVTNSVSSYAGAGDYIYLYTASMEQNLTTTWADQSGNGRNMTQATSIAAPVSLEFPANYSQQAAYFDGDNTRTLASTAADWTFLHDGTGMTWAGVVNGTALVTDPLNRRFWATSSFVAGGGRTQAQGVTFDYQSTQQQFVFQTYNGPSALNLTMASIAGSCPIGSTVRVIVRFNTSNSPDATIWVNGSLRNSANITGAVNAAAPFYPLHYGTIDIAYAKGWILDSYFYNRSLSDYEVTGLDRYLKMTYNL